MGKPVDKRLKEVLEGEPKPVYVVGIQATGGCWLPDGKYYTNKKQAKDIVDKEHAEGRNYIKLFTLYPVKKDGKDNT